MSHRTADLPPLTGIAHVIRELRYHEVARQALAVVLILIYTVTAAPIPVLVAIGLPIALAIGMPRFEQMLAGAAAMASGRGRCRSWLAPGW